MVPEFHVMQAAAEANYKYYSSEWQDLNWQERAKIVALHFARILVHNHSEDAQAAASSKKAAQSAQKGKKG